MEGSVAGTGSIGSEETASTATGASSSIVGSTASSDSGAVRDGASTGATGCSPAEPASVATGGSSGASCGGGSMLADVGVELAAAVSMLWPSNTHWSKAESSSGS